MPADPWPLQSHLEPGALPTAVPCARLHARQMLWEWGLDGLSETAELLVSELVTNAVKVTAGQDLPLPVRLRLSSDKDRLLIEVWDADPRPPVLPGLEDDGTPAPAEEGGRGLFLVATLSQRWNWYAPREWGGKVVWSELELSAGHRRDQHGTDHLREGASPAMRAPHHTAIRRARRRPPASRHLSRTAHPPWRCRAGPSRPGRRAPRTGYRPTRRSCGGSRQPWPGSERRGAGWKESAAERGSTPGRRDDEDGISPLLAGLDTKVRQAITEIIISRCEFRGMGGVWLPHRGRRWTAARPASSRAPGPDLPTAWIHAATGAQPADQMPDVNAQLTARGR